MAKNTTTERLHIIGIVLFFIMTAILTLAVTNVIVGQDIIDALDEPVQSPSPIIFVEQDGNIYECTDSEGNRIAVDPNAAETLVDCKPIGG